MGANLWNLQWFICAEMGHTAFAYASAAITFFVVLFNLAPFLKGSAGNA